MLIATLFLLAAQADAATPAPPAAAAAPEKKICRRDTSIGSRLDVRRTCRTAAEWAAYNRQVEAAENRRQDTRSIGLNGR